MFTGISLHLTLFTECFVSKIDTADFPGNCQQYCRPLPTDIKVFTQLALSFQLKFIIHPLFDIIIAFLAFYSSLLLTCQATFTFIAIYANKASVSQPTQSNTQLLQYTEIIVHEAG